MSLLRNSFFVVDMSSNSTLFRMVTVMAIYVMCSLHDVVSCTAEDQLINELFDVRQYNKASRPVLRVADTTTVELGLVIEKVVELKWHDYRLSWNASEFYGIDVVHIPALYIWIPDILQANNAKDDEGKIGKENQLITKLIRITSDGSCFFYPTSLIVSHCAVDISQFPFDEQHCSIEYELLGHDSGHVQLNVLNVSVDLAYYQENGEWDLLGVEPLIVPMKYSCCKFPYNRLKFMVHLRRKSLYYIFNFVIPCCAFSIVSLATFLLQPGCGERIGLSISCLLGLSVYQTIINSKLPATSDCVPLLGIYYLFVMMMGALSVIMSVVVISLCNSTTVVMPTWMKWLASDRVAIAFGIRKSTSMSSTLKNVSADLLPVPRPDHDIIEQSSKNDDTAYDRISSPLPLHDVMDGKRLVDTSKADDCAQRSRHVSRSIDELVEHIITHLQTKLDEKRFGSSVDHVTAVEWMFVARLIDRMCFVLFSSSLAIGTLAVSLQATFGGR